MRRSQRRSQDGNALPELQYCNSLMIAVRFPLSFLLAATDEGIIQSAPDRIFPYKKNALRLQILGQVKLPTGASLPWAEEVSYCFFLPPKTRISAIFLSSVIMNAGTPFSEISANLLSFSPSGSSSPASIILVSL